MAPRRALRAISAVALGAASASASASASAAAVTFTITVTVTVTSAFAAGCGGSNKSPSTLDNTSGGTSGGASGAGGASAASAASASGNPGDARVVARTAAGGEIELIGERGDAMVKAQAEMTAHCGADSYTITQEGEQVVGGDIPANSTEPSSLATAWRVHYQCSGTSSGTAPPSP